MAYAARGAKRLAYTSVELYFDAHTSPRIWHGLKNTGTYNKKVVQRAPHAHGPEKGEGIEGLRGWLRYIINAAVSYTHLTLPTNREV